MIRLATHDDFLAFRGLAERLHRKSPFADTATDLAEGAKVFRQCLASRLGCVFVAEHKKVVTGVVVGIAQEWWWCHKRVASDLILYAERPGDGLALLRRFIEWAKSVPGVVDVLCSQSSGANVRRTGRIYERAGLQLIGGLYHLPVRAAAVEKAA